LRWADVFILIILEVSVSVNTAEELAVIRAGIDAGQLVTAGGHVLEGVASLVI